MTTPKCRCAPLTLPLAPDQPHLDGGFCVLELPTREDAVRWAARIAAGCRTPQELRMFGDDPES